MRTSIVSAALFALIGAPSAHAQDTTAVTPPRPAPVPVQRPTPREEANRVQVTFIPAARIDLLAGKNSALHAGGSVAAPLSNYFQVGGTLGAGISRTGFSARADLFGSFSLDPYHQMAWEPYLGGGGTVRLDTGGPGTRSYLLGFFGVHAPPTGGIAPSIELGVGGGVRLGVVLRWAVPKR